MYEKVVVPLDGSELAECVLPHVEALAGNSGVKEVVLVRVYDPYRIPSGVDNILSDEDMARVNSEQRSAAEKYLKDLAGRIRFGNIQPRWEVLKGQVAESLSDYARKNNFDLIVIATHGRSGISRWVWGSIADRILRSSCVPVLMVRAPGCPLVVK
jgi:nucleotide-binding universal stress UspA family protein